MKIIYWSSTGNTQQMAEMLGEGIEAAGGSAEVLEVGSVQPDDLKEEAVFALGCSAMGDEELDEGEMEPFVQEVEKFAAGKRIGLFGSYDWGDGEWMRRWESRMKEAGAEIVGGAGVIANNEPDEEAREALAELAKKML
ncbi:MAG: flavodoxin [Lachnospiraceae bacterium]|nr:flavodoxin [Lachnospiraceae bacterium]